MENINNWKNFNNPKLTPSVGPVWTYRSDSWSWVPRTSPRVNVGSNEPEYYWKWLQQQKRIPEPYNSVTYRGGIGSNTARFLSDEIYNGVPDLRSDTVLMKQQIDSYTKKLTELNLLPQDLRRDKI
jgi:hypothetical protein